MGRVALVKKNSSGSASATGESGSASATGWGGSASATGWKGSASATGEMGIAAITFTNKNSIVESGPGGICAVIGDVVQWKVHLDSVLIQRWKEGGTYRTAVLHPKNLKLENGQTIKVNRGLVQKE